MVCKLKKFMVLCSMHIKSQLLSGISIAIVQYPNPENKHHNHYIHRTKYYLTFHTLNLTYRRVLQKEDKFSNKFGWGYCPGIPRLTSHTKTPPKTEARLQVTIQSRSMFLHLHHHICKKIYTVYPDFYIFELSCVQKVYFISLSLRDCSVYEMVYN
jgi:hypothetical protein